ncbi:MAG: sulfur carrier protein ThiS [Melioribacter sp.]|nr:sulfur carrier protein ThiS [Melioribacter sp.]
MKLIVNGKEKILDINSQYISVEDLLIYFDITDKNIAIAINETIISKEHWKEQIIKDGDQIEIVKAVQGG